MGKLFIAIGIAILIGTVVLHPRANISIEKLIDNELTDTRLSAQGAGALTSDEIEPVRKDSLKNIKLVLSDSAKYAKNASLLLQASIVFGALVTIFAGVQRIVKEKNMSDFAIVAAIALFGALAAMSTSLGGHQDQLSKRGFDCARDAQSSVIEILRELSRETDLAVAQTLLDSLSSVTTECST